MVKQCEKCGKSFHVKPSKLRRSKFCSRLCTNAGRSDRNPARSYVCTWCGISFETKEQNHKGKYCSHECDMTHRKTVLFETAPSRFWARVDKSGNCWLWTGATDDKGYGRLSFKGRRAIAPRVAYELTHGVSPGQLQVLHRCDNPPCVNPDHLFLGTNADNIRDMCAKGRAWIQQPENKRHGSDNPSAKLSHEEAVAIREAYANKSMNGVELAEVYGVGNSTIYKVIHRERY